MKALRLTTDPREKKLLDAKCNEYLTRAEQLKNSRSVSDAQSYSSKGPSRPRREPVSTRTLSNREQIILLENSKLNGFVFPPWSAQPDPEEFELDDEEGLFTCVYPGEFVLRVTETKMRLETHPTLSSRNSSRTSSTAGKELLSYSSSRLQGVSRMIPIYSWSATKLWI